LFEQEILTDPAMKIILDQMQEDPKAAQEWVFEWLLHRRGFDKRNLLQDMKVLVSI